MSGNKSNQHITAFFLFLAGWALLAYFTGIFNGFFQLTDDVMYAGLLEKLQHNSFASVLKEIVANDLSIRFRPVALCYYLCVAAIFKLNYTDIMLLNISIAALSCYFFYRFARNIMLNFGSALLLCAILYMGNQGTVGMRTVLSENVAMLFLSISLFFLSKESKFTNRVCQLFFFTLAACTKESFILLFPAMIWGDYLIQKNISFRTYLNRNIKWVVAMLLINLSAVTIILLKPGTHAIGYAGIDKDSFTISNLLSATYSLFISKGYLLSLLPFLLIVYGEKAGNIRKDVNRTIVLLLLIAIPQILLFSKSKIFMHYLMPGMLWSAVAGGLAWQLIGSHIHQRALQLLLKAPILLLLIFNSFLFIKNCLLIGNTGRTIRKTLYTAAENTSPKDSIIIIGHPLYDAEKAMDAKAFLHSYLFNRTSILLPAFTDTSMFYSETDRYIIKDFLNKTSSDVQRKNELFSQHHVVIFMPGTYEMASKEYGALLKDYRIHNIGTFQLAVKP
jgi:hypothetical protein